MLPGTQMVNALVSSNFNLMDQVNFHVQLPLGDRTKGWMTGHFVLF